MLVAGTAGVVLLAVVCGAERPVEEGLGAPIAFETVLDTAYSGVDEPLNEVVRDEGRWAELWEQVHRDVSPRPPFAAVDFSRNMLIAVGVGTRRSSGFDVRIRSVAVRKDRLRVEILETCPAPGAMVAAVLTQPVEVVRVERLPQAADFRFTKAASCE